MDTQRLILLLVFFFSLMMLWDGWIRFNQPPPAAVAPTPAQAGRNGEVPDAPKFASAGSSAVPEAPGGAATAVSPRVLTVRTDVVAAEISSQGGDLVRLELLEHRATGKRDENFVLLDPKHSYAAQSGLIGSGLPNHKSVWSLPAERLELKEGENELRVSLEAPIEGGGKVVKTYVFKRDSYLVEVEHAAVGAPAPVGAHVRDGKVAGV